MREKLGIPSFAAIAAVSLLALAIPSGAQEAPTPEKLEDFESTLFADSETAAEGTAPADQAVAAEAVRTEYLVGGTVVAKTAIAAVVAEQASALVDARGRLFAKVSIPDYGALFISYNASYPFFQGSLGYDDPPAAHDDGSVAYELAELHYSFDIGKKLFVRLGDQLISWGPSRIWSPVDFINREKEDAFADLEFRSGKNGLRLHYPMPKANAFLFADFSALTDSGDYGDPAEKLRFGGRFDFTLGPAEFALTGYGGKNSRFRSGADVSGRVLGTTVYGELAVAPEYASYAGSVQASIGFSRTLDELKRWTLSAEGFFNSSGSDLSGYTAADIASLPEDRRIPLYQGTYYAYAALSASEFIVPDVSAALSAIANLQEASYSAKLSASFDFPRAVPFDIALAYAWGGADKEFTRYPGDRSLSATLTTKLSF